jgi:glycosyltransferase involved in cell wall biosynthesis
MTTLALASTRVDLLRSGYDLRVKQLCAQIPDEVHLVVAPLHPLPDRPPTMDSSSVFATVTELAPILSRPPSARRHFRLDNQRYLRMSRPREFEAARRAVSRSMSEHAVDRIVVFGEQLVEVIVDLPCHVKVLDVCDSVALTKSREFSHAGGFRGGRWTGALDVYRARRTAARLPTSFEHVTTVSDVDTANIMQYSGIRSNVHTVPNGVDDAFLTPMPPSTDRRGVVFWGNLDFGPNADALAYFFDDVWLPRLREAEVEVEVIGANAPSWLVEVAAREPLIRLSGFVTDLRAAVCRYPVMINPMRTGSGLKNKVLEAFGLGVVVVSTSRGVEAIPTARDGEHLVLADDGDAFADAVLGLLDSRADRLRLRANANALVQEHYPWTVAGRPWRALFATSVDCAGG